MTPSIEGANSVQSKVRHGPDLGGMSDYRAPCVPLKFQGALIRPSGWRNQPFSFSAH